MTEKTYNDEELLEGFATWIETADYKKTSSVRQALYLAWLDGVRWSAAKIGKQIQALPDPGANGEDELPDPEAICECGARAIYCGEGMGGSDFWCQTCEIGWEQPT